MASQPIPGIAGQAVIEGVMFRYKRTISMAVRQPNGRIALEKQKFKTWLLLSRVFRLPILRGIIIFFETLILGLKLVSRSANLATAGEEEQLKGWEIALSIVLSIVFVLIIFKLIPYASAAELAKLFGGGNIFLNLVEGVIKILLFIGYVVLIGLMPDVRRMFQYHGAEHKTVNCYEAGKRLTVKNVQSFTKRQPRCGTTFVIIVFVLSIFFYVIIPFEYTFWTKYALRVLLLPIIAGVGYELIKLSGKYYEKACLVRWLLAPGMWFQDLTTREPDDKQVAVAVKALRGIKAVKA